MKNKYLIAYFQPKGSQSKCAKVAEAIRESLAAKGTAPEIFAITPVESYPTDKDELLAVTKQESELHKRPEILPGLSHGIYSAVKTVVLVSPNWWQSVPMAVLSFFDKYNNHGKRILPVILHGGDGADAIVKELRKFLPDSDVLPAIELTSESFNANPELTVGQVIDSINKK